MPVSKSANNVLLKGLGAKEMSPLFQQAFSDLSDKDRAVMREKMMKDISAAARIDPDAMNIKKALKLKDELNAQVHDL
jgi:hypothetical protein